MPTPDVRAAIAAQNAKMPVADVHGQAVADESPYAETTADPPSPAPPAAPRPDMSQGTRGAPPVWNHDQQVALAGAEGRTLDQLALINKPLNEAQRLGMTVEAWRARYGS